MDFTVQDLKKMVEEKEREGYVPLLAKDSAWRNYVAPALSDAVFEALAKGNPNAILTLASIKLKGLTAKELCNALSQRGFFVDRSLVNNSPHVVISLEETLLHLNMKEDTIVEDVKAIKLQESPSAE